MKSHTLYFTDTRVVIADRCPAEGYAVLPTDDCRIARANIVKKVETDKFVAVITPDPDATLAHLLSQLFVVEAAGGIVRDEQGRWLMIRCRDRWDLPKGHIEAGESAVEAALREVREETGIVAEALRHAATTIHCYDTYGRWEAKRTHWFAMRCVAGEPAPQTAEGITSAAWCGQAEAASNLLSSYSTIIDLLGTLSSVENNRATGYAAEGCAAKTKML